MKERCLYCGKKSLELIQNGSGADDAYICGSCGLTVTQSDYNQDLFAMSGDENEKADRAEENAILKSALELMAKKSWNHAAGLLTPPHSPLRRGSEFAVYRSICRSATLLKSRDKAKRYQQLDMLQHNLSCLEQFLSGLKGEEAYRTLQGLYRALMLWGGLEIDWLTDLKGYANDSERFDTTNRRRAEVLCDFARTLEQRSQDDEHGPEYLKMAVMLYHQTLFLAQERYLKHLNAVDEDFMQIPMKMRRDINAAIERLNRTISQSDPAFMPQTALPDPKLYPFPGNVLSFLATAIVMVQCFIIPCIGGEYAYILFIATGVFWGLCFPFLYSWHYDNFRAIRQEPYLPGDDGRKS